MEEHNSLALPVRLFAVQNGKEQIALDLLALQPEKDIFRSGEFAVSYQCEGMDCRFACDLTVENVYYFYTQLDTAYDILFSKNAKAVLQDDRNAHTQIAAAFDETCRCTVSGEIRNKAVQYKSGIAFSMQWEQSDVCDTLISLERFFVEFRRIYGKTVFM